jgi:tRNA ligase
MGGELDCCRRGELFCRAWKYNIELNLRQLCDDSFEEHVLPYPPDKTGLHLHGLNEATGEFKTQPTKVVDQFAADWGFIVTKTVTLNSIQEVRAFSDNTSRTGKWEGEPVEGFVVRTQVTANSSSGKNSSPPYAPGTSLFFKIKFDEPYMMYRDWREVTKTLLAAKVPLNEVKLPESKMKRPETKLYVSWVKGEIQKNRDQFESYNKGKGIIATRERFLEWLKSDKGTKVEQDVSQTTKENNDKFGKTIIVPVAIPGAGEYPQPVFFVS